MTTEEEALQRAQSPMLLSLGTVLLKTFTFLLEFLETLSLLALTKSLEPLVTLETEIDSLETETETLEALEALPFLSGALAGVLRQSLCSLLPVTAADFSFDMLEVPGRLGHSLSHLNKFD